MFEIVRLISVWIKQISERLEEALAIEIKDYNYKTKIKSYKSKNII